MSYREMLELLKAKGVNIDADRHGFKIDSDHEFLKFWMVRTKDEGDDMFMFCCGFDMLNNGRLVISHRDYPVDENIFDSLMDAIRRNEGCDYEPENILLCPDWDYYDSSHAEREKDEMEIKYETYDHVDLLYTKKSAYQYTFTALSQSNGTVYSGTMRIDGDSLRGDIRKHWDRTQPAEHELSYVPHTDTISRELVEYTLCDLCDLVGLYVDRVFEL